MAITFNKKSWKSRISEHPTRRRLTIVDQSLSYSLVDVARDEGTVEQVGDTFDKSTMDDLENRIENIAITAQAECDGLQEQIDNLPSLDDTKAIDIGWKESGTRNVGGDTIRVNNYDLFMGEIGKQFVKFGRVYGSTSQRTSPAPSPSDPAPINGVGVQGANNTWSVSKTVNGCTATVTGLPYPLYEGDYIDFDAGILHRANGYIDLGSLTWTRNQYGTITLLYANIISYVPMAGTIVGGYDCLCETYVKFNGSAYQDISDKEISWGLKSFSSTTPYVVVHDDDYSDASTFQSDMSGVYLLYELVTATDTQVTVAKTGKNLFDKDDSSMVLSGFLGNDGKIHLSDSVNSRTICILVEPNTTYTISKIQSTRFRVASCPAYPVNLDEFNGLIVNDSSESITITIGVTDSYLLAYVYNSDSDTLTPAEILASLQVEKNGSATSYESYTLPTVIRGFIPSAKFFQMGRRYWQEEPVKTYLEDLNDIYKGMRLNVDNNAFVTQEQVDKDRVNDILTMYGYDYDHDEFLTSVSGEIYTSTGKIPCDLVVTDIWGCGANNATEVVLTTTNPIQIDDRTASNSNGFPIELKPVNQTAVASLVVGSPVFFRITGELYILLHMGYDLREYTDGSDMSQFYKLKRWIDTRDGMHYSTHYIEIEKGSTFNLSSITTARGYNFLQCSVRTGQSIDPRDYLEWTVTDSEVAITATASATGYAEGLILEIDHRMINDTQGQYDTHESIIVKTIPAST